MSADLDKYQYSGYGIRFYSRSEFEIPDGTIGKNVIIFEVDMSSSERVYNMGKYILILHEEATQGLRDTALRAEAKDPINFTQSGNIYV